MRAPEARDPALRDDTPRDETALVIEDTAPTRYAFARRLRRAGFVVEEAETGAQALARLSARIDLVVLDLWLPDTDGYELSRRLREQTPNPRLKIILTSAGFRSPGDIENARDPDVDAYLAQPHTAAELVALARRLLDDREPTRP
jgi:CheY-like chemotaxis protein